MCKKIYLDKENIKEKLKGIHTNFIYTEISDVIKDKKTNEIVGIFEIYIDKKTIHLQTVEILYEYQDKGYGTAFLNELFDTYPNCTKIVGQSLESATHFYEKFNADWWSTCDKCSCKNTCMFYKEGDFDEMCDDYTENMFTIKKTVFKNILKEINNKHEEKYTTFKKLQELKENPNYIIKRKRKSYKYFNYDWYLLIDKTTKETFNLYVDMLGQKKSEQIKKNS